MSDSESEFKPVVKVNQTPRSKSAAPNADVKKSKKQIEKVKGGKGGKNEKAEKPTEKQPKKKKEKEKQSKAKKEEEGLQQSKSLVLDYMEKQNRPYNLLNIFDNLHGKIKKPLLETILNELTEEQKLTAKQFGKNIVYYINQDNFNVSKETIDQLGSQYTELRIEEVELNQRFKAVTDQYKKLISRRTIFEIRKSINELEKTIEELNLKKQRLMSEGSEKVDEHIVEKIEKDQVFFRKQLSKRRKLTRQCLSMWGEMLQKKVSQVAQMMGVQI